ncbi:hypothetical protein GCM10020254_28520 [Streptomyces goshikiensis]
MPRAPPNSCPVSSREAAEPAFSAGAEPRAMSPTRDITVTIPEASTPAPVSRSQRESVPTRPIRANPAAARAKPPAMT